MSSMRVGHWLMVPLWMVSSHMKQGGYSIGFTVHQNWRSDPRWWYQRFLHATRSQGWNQFHISSHGWHCWMVLPLRVFWPPGLVHGLEEVLGAPEVESSGSLKGGRGLNKGFAVNTTPVLHRSTQDSHCAPYLRTLQRYSPTQMTTATP